MPGHVMGAEVARSLSLSMSPRHGGWQLGSGEPNASSQKLLKLLARVVVRQHDGTLRAAEVREGRKEQSVAFGMEPTLEQDRTWQMGRILCGILCGICHFVILALAN